MDQMILEVFSNLNDSVILRWSITTGVYFQIRLAQILECDKSALCSYFTGTTDKGHVLLDAKCTEAPSVIFLSISKSAL